MRLFDPDVEQTAGRLRAEVNSAEVEIFPYRKWATVIFDEEGVALVIDEVNTEVYEVMRRRLLWSRVWRTVQSPEDVLEAMLEFMRDRPDLRVFRE